MKIVSFNVNSVRQRLHQLQSVIDKHAPEFIGLQETKVQDHEFPLEAITAMGYQAIYMGQKTHYGVALLSRQVSSTPYYGFPGDPEDAQKRFIGGEFQIDGEPMLVFNGYFPQGESRDHAVKFPAKIRLYEDLNQFLVAYEPVSCPRSVNGLKAWRRKAYTMVFVFATLTKTTVSAGSIIAAVVLSVNQNAACESII
jgi:exodeoxyribonuclease-3